MVLAPSVAGLFKWRQFEPEVILLAVGWYLRFSLLPRRRGTLGRTRDKAVVELKREKLAAESSGRHRIQQNNHTVPV